MIQRAAVVAEALTWIGTPFQHAQSCKGRGTDCVGLALGVYRALGAIPSDFYPAPYSQQWHVHKNEELLLASIKGLGGIEIELGTQKPGDLLLFRFGRVCSHIGIYIGGGEMVHAYFGLQRAVRQPVSGEMGARLRKVVMTPWIED